MTTEQMAYCWGDSGNGQLGAGAAVACNYLTYPCSAATPVPVAGGLRFVQISAGRLHTCGITGDGTGYCWGSNRNGQLGTPAVPICDKGFQSPEECLHDVPTLIAGGLKFAQLAAGASHTCGITTVGQAYCWGLVTGDLLGPALALGNPAYSGQLGTPRGSRIPVPVLGGLSFREITAGNYVSCGLTVGGEGVCWGENRSGELGIESIAPIFTANALSVRMPLSQRAPSIGEDSHACAPTITGRIWCWGGYNFFGEVGSEPVSEPGVIALVSLRRVPTPVNPPQF